MATFCVCRSKRGNKQEGCFFHFPILNRVKTEHVNTEIDLTEMDFDEEEDGNILLLPVSSGLTIF